MKPDESQKSRKSNQNKTNNWAYTFWPSQTTPFLWQSLATDICINWEILDLPKIVGDSIHHILPSSFGHNFPRNSQITVLGFYLEKNRSSIFAGNEWHNSECAEFISRKRKCWFRQVNHNIKRQLRQRWDWRTRLLQPEVNRTGNREFVQQGPVVIFNVSCIAGGTY